MNWYKYWNENEIVNNANLYRQVGMTSYGRHPSIDEWNRLISEIHKLIDLRESDTVLDLCCGNGMISNSIAKSCQGIVAVDFSKKLLGNFIPVSKKIHKINCDIRDIDFKNEQFDSIIFSASIQHLSERESIVVIGKCNKWLKENGKLIILDIPDLKRKWNFYSNKKYRNNYISSIIKDELIIGTWFDDQFMISVGHYFNFSKTSVIEQDSYRINHSFRFDALLEK